MSRVNHGQVTVTSTAAPLTTDTGINTSTLLIKAARSNSTDIYVGTSGVTTSTGFPLAAGEELRVVFSDRQGETADVKPSQFYVVGSSGTVAWIAQR